MSIDTADKRYSAVHVGEPWRGINVFPASGVPVSDRLALARLYSGSNFGFTYTLVGDAGTFAMTGNSVTLTPQTQINTSQERFAAVHLGNAWRGPHTFPTGSIGRTQRSTLAGFYVPYVSGPTYSLEALSGSFVWDGEPSFSDFEVTAETAQYVMTGSDAILIATRTLYADAGVFTMTGRDAQLDYFTGRTLIAEPGVFEMTGYDAILDRQRTIVAESGVFELTGYPAIFTWFDESGQPVVITVETPSGGYWPDYGKPRKKKKKREITPTRELVTKDPPFPGIHRTKRIGKPLTEAEKRRLKEEEELLLG